MTPMQNRFGIKDLFVILLLLAIAIGGIASMVQRDRQWMLMRDIQSQLKQVESRIGQLEDRMSRGVMMAPGAGAARGGMSAAQVASDDSWARPGVPIKRWPMPEPATEPTDVPGYAIGGVFTELFEAQPAKLVPYIGGDVYYTRVLDRVCESLGRFDPKTLEFVGQLADAWQIDPDGLWIRAHINPLARFSDGKPVTAEDFRWTYMDFIQNPLIEAERSRSTQDNLKDVLVVNDQTVEFTFKEPLFTNILIALGNGVLPKHYYSKFEPSQINQATGIMMGSGQFKLERMPEGPDDLASQWTPGQDVVLVRNEQYWARKPSLAGMRFRSIKDDLGRLVAFKNGEGSMMLPTSPQFNAVLRDEPDFEKTTHALKWTNMRCGYSFIAWQCGPRNGKPTPFADKRVRRAMTMLLDRERMIRDIWDGIGSVSKGPVNPESPGSNPDVKPLPFDPEAAKALLAEAGWKDRNGDGILENEQGDAFTFEYTYATGGEVSERIARFVKDSYGKAGIVVKTRPVDWSRYQELLKLRDFDAITLAWGSNAPESDPRQIWHSESTKEGGDNFTQWR
ncbi:MAG: hypothetical protein FGM37_10150, partial [Phycisphaerales bacterium]|nr:hypothetical protein [Phycisphaerales bacterium]